MAMTGKTTQEMSLSRTIFTSMLAQLSGRLYTAAVSFLVTMVLLARTLTPAGFGIFNFYLTLFNILITIIDFGTNTIAIREASQSQNRLPGLLKALMCIKGIISLASLVALCAIALFLETEESVRYLVCIASFHLLFHCLAGYNTVFHVKMRFGYAAFVSCVGHTVFLGISAVAFVNDCRNPGVYLIAYGAGMVITNLGNFFFGRSMIKDLRGNGRSELGPLLRESLPLGLSTLMITLYFYMDTVLLRVMEGEEAVGYYNAAYRILVFAIMIPVLFNQVIFPIFSRYIGKGEDKRAQLRSVFQRAVIYMGTLGIPAAIVLWLLSDPLIVAICGDTYQRSGECLAILSLAMALVFITYPHTSLLIASGRQSLFAWIALGGAVLNIGLNVLWIPKYSIIGASWATVVTELFICVAAIVCIKRYQGFSALVGELIKVPIMGALCGIAGYLLRAQALYVVLPVIGVLYFAGLYLVRLLPFDIRDEIRN